MSAPPPKPWRRRRHSARGPPHHRATRPQCNERGLTRGDSPEVDASDGISAESDRELRGYYGIGTGDQELRSDNKSYATLVAEEPGEASRVEDAGQLETPDPDTRTEESMQRLQDSQRREARSGGVGGVTGEDQDDSGDGRDPDQ